MIDLALKCDLIESTSLLKWIEGAQAATDQWDRPRTAPCGDVAHEQNVDHLFLAFLSSSEEDGDAAALLLGELWGGYPWVVDRSHAKD